MGIFDKWVGSNIAQPVEAVGNVLDKLFTSDEEKLDKQILLERLRQEPALAQVELNKVEAQHRTVFVAGWRPFIGWVCGWNLLYLTFLRDIIVWAFSVWAPEISPPPALGLDLTVELVVALLGLGILRTAEKAAGKSK